MVRFPYLADLTQNDPNAARPTDYGDWFGHLVRSCMVSSRWTTGRWTADLPNIVRTNDDFKQ